MFRCQKRGPDVIVSGMWPPIPIDEWQLTMDPRKLEEFSKKWKKDMEATLRELDGSVGSSDQGMEEKAGPHLPSLPEFPLDLATTQQRVQLRKTVLHLPSPPEFRLDLAMKLEEKFENESILDSELGNTIVDESDPAPTTEQKPMTMEKKEKHAPPEPPPIQQGGSQKPSHVSPKLMLLKGQHAFEECVATNDTRKTKKKKDWPGSNSTKRMRLDVESDSDTTTESEAHKVKPRIEDKEKRRSQEPTTESAKEEESRKGESTAITAITARK